MHASNLSKLIIWLGVKAGLLQISFRRSWLNAFSFFAFHLFLLLGMAYFMTAWEFSPTKTSLLQVLGHWKCPQQSCGTLYLEVLVSYHISSVCFVAGEERNSTCKRCSVVPYNEVPKTWLSVMGRLSVMTSHEETQLVLAVPPFCMAALTHYALFQAK